MLYDRIAPTAACIVSDKIAAVFLLLDNLSDFYRKQYVMGYNSDLTLLHLAHFDGTGSERLLRSNVDRVRSTSGPKNSRSREERARFLHRNVTYQHRCQLFRGYLLLSSRREA